MKINNKDACASEKNSENHIITQRVWENLFKRSQFELFFLILRIIRANIHILPTFSLIILTLERKKAKQTNSFFFEEKKSCVSLFWLGRRAYFFCARKKGEPFWFEPSVVLRKKKNVYNSHTKWRCIFFLKYLLFFLLWRFSVSKKLRLQCETAIHFWSFKFKENGENEK